MDEAKNRHICLKLADKSLYNLYNSGQAGEREITITPASKNQEKNEISLYDCTAGEKRLLRDILLENPGEMKLNFSLGLGYLSYKITTLSGVLLDKGLIELVQEEKEEILSSDSGRGRSLPRGKKRRTPKRGWIVFSVFLTLGIIVVGGMALVNRADRTELPPLTTSEMPPR